MLHSSESFQAFRKPAVVFSFFSRRDKADARKGRDSGPPRAPDSTVRGPAGADSTVMQRELARQTAEKIDQIESEMIAAALPVPPAPRRVQEMQQAAALAPAPAGAAGTAGAATPGRATPSDNTTIVLGDHSGAGEIHVQGAQLPPQLEEAAILFANGQPQPAMVSLRQAIAQGGLGDSEQQAWLMLFDMLNHGGMHDEFDSLAIDFASTFEKSPPPWRAVDLPSSAGDKVAAGPTVMNFPAQIDESAGRLVEQIHRAAKAGRQVIAEFRAVRRVDPAGAGHLFRLIESFKQGRQGLLIGDAAALFEAARSMIEAGRRDDTEMCWMLALEMLRVQGQKQAFDDLAIDYCVTFEVSPPSWEPMPDNIRTTLCAEPVAPGKAAQAPADEDSFVMRGELAGKASTLMARFRAWAANRQDVTVDCHGLTRVDFVAAGELVNEIIALRGRNARVLFVEPSYAVLALMIVMGIHDLADIRRRKF